MRFLLRALIIFIAMMVLTGLWLIAQVMHYIVPIIILLVVFGAWDQLRGKPPAEREYADPKRN